MKALRISVLVVFLCASIAAAQIKSQSPTTGPSGKLDAAERAIAEAVAAVQDAQKSAEAAFDSLPSTKKLVSDVAAAEAALTEARKTGTPQEKLDASSKFNKLRLKLSADRETAVATDSRVVDAKTKAAAATATLAAVQHDIAAADAANQAQIALQQKAREDADPIFQAIKRHELVVGMTMDQATQAMVRMGYVERTQSIQGQTVLTGLTEYEQRPKAEKIAEDAISQTYQWKFDRELFWARFEDGKIVQCGKQ